MKKLRGEALEMWIYKRILNISHQQHISNEDFYVGLNIKPTAHENDLKKKKVQMFWPYSKGRKI